jgi:hypothetical protein
MPMRTYKANRWLWCLASVVVFVGIGLLVQFDNKGVNAPLGLLVLRNLTHRNTPFLGRPG